MRTPGIIILALLIVYANHSMAQDSDINEQDFTRFTLKDGISADHISSIAQDSIGYVWAATSLGLNRYDGSHFVQFHSSDDSLSLPAEQIMELRWLDGQRLAAITVMGLHVFNTVTGECRNIVIPYKKKQYQYKFNRILGVSNYNNGDIILLTRSGLYHYDKEYRLIYRYDHYPDNEVSDYLVFGGGDMVQLDDQRFLIPSYLGLHLYNAAKHEVKKLEPSDCPLLSEWIPFPRSQSKILQEKKGCFIVIPPGGDSLVHVNIAANRKTTTLLPVSLLKDNNYGWRLSMFRLNDTVFYLTGHASGFYKMILNPQTGSIRFFKNKYLSSYRCNSLLKDKNGYLWVATNKGLLKQGNSKTNLQQASLPASFDALFPNIAVEDICGVGEKLYVGCRGNGGLLVYDKKSLQFIRRINFNNNDGNNVTTLADVNDRTLMIGTTGTLFLLDLLTYKKTKINLDNWDAVHHWIANLKKDSKGNIWISGNENIYKYDQATQQFTLITKTWTFPSIKATPAWTITEDNAGNIWMANEGLCRYNTTLNRFDKLIDSFPYTRMPDARVGVIAGLQNDLWINIANNGLANYDIGTGKFRHFTTSNGLPGNNIQSIGKTGDKLWFTSSYDMACLDMKTFGITTFGKEDKFPELPVTNGSSFFYDTANKMLYVTFSKAFVRFRPDIIFHSTPVPAFFIESIAVGNQHRIYLPPQNITMSWKENDIRIAIGSVNFLNSNSQRFAYRLLEGDSTHWQQLGMQNTFSIANLSPGVHRIQVKLFSLSNRWPGQVKEFTIRLLPPFWVTLWFRLLVIGLLAGAIYWVFKQRIDAIKKRERQAVQVQQLKTEDYRYRLELEQISTYFSSSLTGKKDIGEILWDIVQNLISRMGYADCMIYLWDADHTKMVQKAAYGPKGSPEALLSQVFDVSPGEGVVGYVINTKEPVLIPDTRKDERYRMDEMFRLSEICVPILHNGELLGVIDSEHHELNYFKERDLKILMTIATLTGNKLKQLESEQSLQMKHEELMTINEQLAEAQLSALQTQMNPHFIFNALNGIKRMILTNDANNASRYLSKFALMIRLTLNQSRQSFATLRENIDYLESYLAMEKLRFGSTFSYHIQTEENLEDEEILVPTLMIQPLVENAIWHGQMNNEGKNQLNIGFSRQEDTFTCTVEDNGIGIQQSKKRKLKEKSAHNYQSVGLDNLRKRIHIMNKKYHMDCALDIIDRGENGDSSSGTLATLSFKIIDR